MAQAKFGTYVLAALLACLNWGLAPQHAGIGWTFHILQLVSCVAHVSKAIKLLKTFRVVLPSSAGISNWGETLSGDVIEQLSGGETSFISALRRWLCGNTCNELALRKGLQISPLL